ncbi:MAG: response regulator, partial [Pirellulaceae bacterium]|nr:response regulator [Pirellulaceae bacterium]
METQPVTLLVVDDDEVDAQGIERAFRKQKIANPLVFATDGIEALKILRGDDGPTVHRPFLILLDLNMPRMGGLEFLGELRADERLRDSIVFVLTTSDADQDKIAAYEKNVAGYIVKARAGDDFLKLLN